MDKEVVIKVLTDSKHVVIELFDFSMLAEDLDIFHLVVDHSIEESDHLFTELLSELVTGEVSQTLVDQPQMHIGDRVVNMEVILEVESVNEFP